MPKSCALTPHLFKCKTVYMTPHLLADYKYVFWFGAVSLKLKKRTLGTSWEFEYHLTIFTVLTGDVCFVNL